MVRPSGESAKSQARPPLGSAASVLAVVVEQSPSASLYRLTAARGGVSSAPRGDVLPATIMPNGLISNWLISPRWVGVVEGSQRNICVRFVFAPGSPAAFSSGAFQMVNGLNELVSRSTH